MEVYHGGDGPKAVELEKDPKDLKIKNRKRTMWHRSRGARFGGPSGGPSCEEIAAEEGQGWPELWWKED